MPARLEGGGHVQVGFAVAGDDSMANNDSGNIVTRRLQKRVDLVTLFGGFKSSSSENSRRLLHRDLLQQGR